MGIKIPQQLKQEFFHGFNDYIKSMGRSIKVYLGPTKVNCPNCLWDSVQNKSSNVYNDLFKKPVNIFPGTPYQKKIYPIPFNVVTASGVQYDPANLNPKILIGKICPICKGDGVLKRDNIFNFIAVVTIGKNDSPEFKDLSAGRDGVQFARIKTYSSNYAICREAKFFLIDGIKYKAEEPARLKGLGGLHITEVYLSEVEEGPSVNVSQDSDPRILNTSQGQASNQAEDLTPDTPPEVPGDDEW